MSVPKGSLPVFSVNTEEEAETLLAWTCPLGYDGQYRAPELVEDQTLENLDRVSDRLAIAYDRMTASG